MMFQIQNDLSGSTMNCAGAIDLSTQLFQSPYVNNRMRMLYASAQGCNVGIQLYPLLNSFQNLNFTSPDAIFKALVQLFPSRTALDSKLQSTWLMQDALQATLNDGTVVGAADQILINAYNTGSDLSRDHTNDANSFLVFTAMAGVGTSLNRYGYLPTDDPASLAYAPTQTGVLPWTAPGVVPSWSNQAGVLGDTSHAACSLVSSLYNMFDAISAVSGFTSGAVKSAFALIGVLQVPMDFAGNTQCTADGFTAPECQNAAARLRYRDACFESNVNASKAAASYTAGVIQAIIGPGGWQ